MATINIIIETPKGSKTKYQFKNNKLVIDHKLPQPMPVNYGFINHTKSGDSEPLDALYFSRKTKKLAKIRAKIIGVMQFIDCNKIDDKILCVPAGSEKSLKDMKSKLEYIQHFFETYKHNTKVLGFGGVGKALKAISEAKE